MIFFIKNRKTVYLLRSYFTLGMAKKDLSEHRDSLFYLEEAKKLLSIEALTTDVSYSSLFIRIYSAIGYVHSILGDYENSYKYTDDAINYFHGLDENDKKNAENIESLVWAYIYRGSYHLAYIDCNKAKRDLLDAKKHLNTILVEQDSKNNQKMARISLQLGNACLLSGSLSLAIENYKENIKAYEYIYGSDAPALVPPYLSLGLAIIPFSIDESSKFLSKAKKIMECNKDTYGVGVHVRWHTYYKNVAISMIFNKEYKANKEKLLHLLNIGIKHNKVKILFLRSIVNYLSLEFSTSLEDICAIEAIHKEAYKKDHKVSEVINEMKTSINSNENIFIIKEYLESCMLSSSKEKNSEATRNSMFSNKLRVTNSFPLTFLVNSQKKEVFFIIENLHYIFIISKEHEMKNLLIKSFKVSDSTKKVVDDFIADNDKPCFKSQIEESEARNLLRELYHDSVLLRFLRNELYYGDCYFDSDSSCYNKVIRMKSKGYKGYYKLCVVLLLFGFLSFLYSKNALPLILTFLSCIIIVFHNDKDIIMSSNSLFKKPLDDDLLLENLEGTLQVGHSGGGGGGTSKDKEEISEDVFDTLSP